MRHIIRKQIIKLSIDTQLDGFQIQELVSRHYWNTIVPMMEKILNAFSSEDEVISLDSLEIDLGQLNEKNIIKENWTVLLESRLTEMLTRLIHQKIPGREVVTQTKRLSVFRQWLFYMQHGYLPWNSGSLTDAWYLEVLETLAIDFESVRLLRTGLLSDLHLVQRIVSVHRESFLQQLAEVITAEKQVHLPAVVSELVLLKQFISVQQKKTSTSSEPESRRIVWKEAIQQAAFISENRLPNRLTEKLVATIVLANPPVLILPRRISIRLPHIQEQVNKIIGDVRASRLEEIKRIKKTIKQLQKDTGKQVSDSSAAQKNKIRDIPATAGEKKAAIPSGGKSEIPKSAETGQSIIGSVNEEGIFVSNAGMVLLHPFLHILFGRLNWVANKQFLSLRNQQQAMYMLHYLATGSEHAEEFELVVPRALCSYPLEESVDPDIKLRSEEIREADDMLAAAIEQWSILKNASATALREGFLQRSGKLSVKNGSLHLQVEHSSIDMLLDYLPWSLSMIMLPWMKDILRVEWR